MKQGAEQAQPVRKIPEVTTILRVFNYNALWHGAVITVVLMILSACSAVENEPLGSKNNPIKIFFTPSVDADDVLSKSELLIKLLEKETGYAFVSAVPASYIVLVESFGTKKCDIACMNSFGYLLANQKYGAEARLRILRKGEAFYRGEIIARANSGIVKLKDIEGKSFAFTDPASTSGYLLPLKLFKQNKITLSEQVFAMRHDSVVVMVYQGKVDAGACFYSPPDAAGNIRDARARVVTQFPDVDKKVSIVALTDPIPNDPIVFRKDLPEAIKKKVTESLIRILTSNEGREAFFNLYSGDGVMPTSDKDYDVLRSLVQFSGKTSQELLGK